VAFVATLYGVGLANLICLPIADRLKSIVASQVARRDMMADVFYGIASGDNARVTEERMSAYR
jgi:chemotaxis protein MotA